MSLRDEVDALAQRFGLDAPARDRLAALAEGLVAAEWAPTSDRDPTAVLERHLADSLVALELPPIAEAGQIADLGAGAGFPGLALAAALPQAEVVLVEAAGRKAAFIAALAAQAGLANARAVTARAEDWADGIGAFDVVTARALGSLPVVLEYAAPLLRVGGAAIAWRGRRDADEEADAAAAAAELGLREVGIRRVTPFAGATDRHLHAYVKSEPTPERFPRRAGVARKRPLGRVP